MARIVWFHPRPVYPPQSGGGVRTAGLIQAALAEGHTVMLVQVGGGESPGPEGTPTLSLRERPIFVRIPSKLFSRWPISAPRPRLGDLRAARRRLAAFQPELAVVSEPLGATLAAPLIGRIPFVFDSHNATSDLYGQLAASEPRRFRRLLLAMDARRIARVEKDFFRRARAVLAASPENATRFRELAPDCTVWTVANTVSTPAETVDPASSDPIVLFVGTLDYLPNERAVEELIARVMPGVRVTVGDARLLVVGRQPSPALRALMSSEEWITFDEGPADLRSSYLQARCTVLPIRYGSGSRLKVYEALAFGLPIVATSSAMEGVEVPAGEGWLLGQSSEDLVSATVRLLSDPMLANRVGQLGRSRFVASLSWERSAAPALAQALDESLA